MRYSHRRLHDLAGAVEKLPAFLPDTTPGREALRPTGTDDARPLLDNAQNVLAHCLALLTPKYPDLALLVKRWHALPQLVRAGIVAMVRAVQSESNG